MAKKATPKKATPKKATPKKDDVQENNPVETVEVSQETINAATQMNELFEMKPQIDITQSEESIIEYIKEHSSDIEKTDKPDFTKENWEWFENHGMLEHLKVKPTSKKSSTLPIIYTRPQAFVDTIKKTNKETVEIPKIAEIVNKTYMENAGKLSNPNESLWITKLGIKLLVALGQASVKGQEVTFNLPE